MLLLNAWPEAAQQKTQDGGNTTGGSGGKKKDKKKDRKKDKGGDGDGKPKLTRAEIKAQRLAARGAKAGQQQQGVNDEVGEHGARFGCVLFWIFWLLTWSSAFSFTAGVLWLMM